MPIRTAAEALQAGTPDTQDLQRIQERSSRSHEAYLAALGKRREQLQSQAQQQVPVGVGGNLQEYARGRLSQLGFDDPSEWSALQQLWQKESGWNPNAVNRSSGAFGIAQTLPSARPTAKRNMSAQEQIEWGLNYIKNRYGTPSRAWQHSQRTNWY